MSANLLKERLARRPFEPFRVRLSNGDAHEVRHPEMALLYKAGIYIARADAADEVPDDVTWCSLLHVAAVEPLGTETASDG